MLDERPTSAELIAAVAEFIEKKAAPQLDAHTACHAKVALNVLHIVERELERDRRGGADDAELARLRKLCGTGDDAGITALNRELCARIADGRIAIDDPALQEHLMLSALDRIAVDNPKYPSLTAVATPSCSERA
jgi:Domain of unknown function (DUF6285)